MLYNWLSPLPNDKSDFIQNLDENQFGKRISIYLDIFPKLENVKIAIIGVNGEAANKVRDELYKLITPSDYSFIADLGNVRKSEDSFLIPLFQELLASDILPIIIGSDNSEAYSQFQAYNYRQSLTNIITVDQIVPNSSSLGEKDTYLEKIVEARKSHLFNLSILGFQSHFCNQDILDYFSDRNFELIRLGSLRSDIEATEPIIRDGDMLNFHVGAIRASDAPAQFNPFASGLFIEEACQLTRYAGISDKLTSFGIYGYNFTKDQDNITAKSLALLVWYFIDGFTNRKQDFPISSENMMEYIVQSNQANEEITFWKSNKSGRWWMQIPVETKEQLERHKLIPCSYDDYLKTCNEEIPSRLLNAYQRFL